jgi:hypothetical protein
MILDSESNIIKMFIKLNFKLSQKSSNQYFLKRVI